MIWIKSSVQLPEQDQWVLFIPNLMQLDICMGEFYEDEGIRWGDYDWCNDFSYWMPLPEKPKGLEEEIMKSQINFALRLKPELYEKVREIAEKNERSINQTINLLLKQAVQGKRK